MKQFDRLLRSLVQTVAAVAAVMLVAGCGSDDPNNPGNNQITVPTTYTYTSRFDAGKSSVNYSGEVVQNLLIDDLAARIATAGAPGASQVSLNDLLAYYDHNDAANLQSSTQTGSLPPLQRQYNLIATGQSLKSNASSAQLVSYGKTTDQLVQELLQVVVTNSQDQDRLGTPMAYTTDDGVDVGQFVATLLRGAVSYYQATSVHLKGIESRNNSSNNGSTDAPATAMERAWDAAFGYFGAARDYGRYTDANLGGPVSDYVFDTNGDGKIDFRSEYNFTFARLAGLRDGASSQNFTKKIFDAFLTGRAVIAGQGTSALIQEERETVVETWEQIIGATLIHYINRMVVHLDALTDQSSPENSAEMNRDWAAMKALALTLQFNPDKQIEDQDLQIVHNYLKTAPQYFPPGTSEYSAYRAALGLARTIIQNAYAFSGTDTNAW